MPLILSIETATSVCSIALAQEGVILDSRESSARNSHASVITVLIDEVLKNAGKVVTEIDAVAISKGPGSYTGLRIGVATAKGICFALGKPLIAVSTLQSLAFGMRKQMPPGISKVLPFLFCPMIDARRMEVYCALYDEADREIMKPAAEIIQESSFSTYLDKCKVVFAGDGAAKCKSLLEQNKNAIFSDELPASATHMVAIADEKYVRGHYEDVAYFEPFYLKDFIAGKPIVKGLR